MPCISKMIPSSSNLAKVIKAPIVACLTCPLCGSLFREATTISECLHTFCKECIHERFSDDEINSCPMCNVDLGTVPLEKLRADPQLDDVQAKIFMCDPTKRPVTVVKPVTQGTPTRRKERSLSSLGLVSVPSSSKSRRSRKKVWVTESSESDQSDDEPPDLPSQEQESSEAMDSDSKSGSERAGTSRKKRRVSRVNSVEAKQLDGDLTALSCLAELAHADKNTRSSKGRTTGRENVSLRATKNVRRSSQGRIDSHANGATKASTTNPTGIWFTLKSATIQGDDKGLPQIKAPYLRIKDGKLPVSYVKKYLVKKLDLKNESEVEITCRGQPVVSSLPLESVRKIWMNRNAASQEQASSTGQEFLMVLTYGRNKRALVS